MKKIIVLGNSGMLGHMMVRYLRQFPDKYEVYGYGREDVHIGHPFAFPDDLNRVDYVINCIGILNNKTDIQLYADVNVVFPKMLSDLSNKLIHISTNCVFKDVGPHLPTDTPDATDLYGRSKAMGEIINDKDLTIRTSIIGTELKENGTGLINQFIRNPNFNKGYANIMWNGVTTLELAMFIEKNLDLVGLHHYFTFDPINKYDLVCLINDIWDVGKNVKKGFADVHHSLLDGPLYTTKRYIHQLKEMKEFV